MTIHKMEKSTGKVPELNLSRKSSETTTNLFFA